MVNPRGSEQSIFTILIKCFKNNPLLRLMQSYHGLDSLLLGSFECGCCMLSLALIAPHTIAVGT